MTPRLCGAEGGVVNNLAVIVGLLFAVGAWVFIWIPMLGHVNLLVVLLAMLGFIWLLGMASAWCDKTADRLDQSATAATADRLADRARLDQSARRPRRAVWLEKWARIHSAALKTTLWRRPRLRRGRFATRPNRGAPATEAPGVRCSVCAPSPCVCNVAELERRGGAASEGLGCEPGFRRTFRGGAGPAGGRPGSRWLRPAGVARCNRRDCSRMIRRPRPCPRPRRLW